MTSTAPATGTNATQPRRRLTSAILILANLVLGENVVPEFIQQDCRPETLAAALAPLLAETAERGKQTEAFAKLDAIMEIGTAAPAGKAADIVLDLARRPQP